MDKKIEITLIRHGSTIKSNQDKFKFLGSRNNLSLSREGISQVKILFEKLDKNISKILCSDLNRSIETAKIISYLFKEKLNKNIPIIICWEIREIDLGRFSDMTRQEIEDIDSKIAPIFFTNQIEKWSFPGGENYFDISKRLDLFYTKLTNLSKPKEHILIIGHGLINRVFLSKFVPRLKSFCQDSDYPYDKIINFNLLLRN